MKNKKVSHKVYGAWEYEQEIEDLNKASEQGWQLVKGGCFHSVYEWDDKKRFVYQLDYTPELADKDRYIELFREDGWEYLNSTFNGWNYFRKPYQEVQDNEEQFIYTDTASLYEMENRYARMILIVAILFGVLTMVSGYHLISVFSLGYLLQVIGYAMLTLLFGMARINITRKRNHQKAILNIPLRIMYPMAFLFIVGAMFLV